MRPRSEPCVGLLEPGRVDDAEAQGAEPRLAFAAVAGDARAVVDERELLADEAVEQGRLADVRPSDDGDGGRHASPSTRYWVAWTGPPATRAV